MPVVPTYPGVYIEEVPSGVRTITGVSTSVAAFVDFFARGPVDEAVQILSFADFERMFGGLDTRSEASYGINQFFLNGGSQAWAVRVAAGAAAPATADLLEGGSPVFTATAGRRVRGASVEDPGEWGNNLRIEIDFDSSDPTSRFNITVSEIATEAGRQVTRQTESFRNLTMAAGPDNALETVNEGSRLIQLSAGAAAGPPEATGTYGAELPAAPVIPAQNDQFDVDAGGGTKQVTIDYGSATAPTDYPGLRPYLERAIRAADPGDPLLSGASVRLVGSGTAASPYRFHVLAGRGGPAFDPAATLTFADQVADDLGLVTGATVNRQQYTLSNGDDGDLPDAAALEGSDAAKTGFHALDDVDIFNILCLPRAGQLGDTDARAVYAAAETYCRDKRAFLIVDIPDGLDGVDDMQTWMSQNDTIRDRNAAVYFPRPRIADPLNQNRLRSVGASGTIAGVYASIDTARGVWKTAAGTEARLRGVQELDVVLTDAENGVLNPIGINCLRKFPIFGIVAWGGRTLEGSDAQASEWKYIAVRRLALFLEESLYRGTKWVVFEPNDEPLWAQIRLNVGAFMQDLFRKGAFQGTTAREAFFVKCDKETTTQFDIDRGIVNIVVGFAPLKPAEFVILRIQQIAQQPQS